MGVVGIAIKGFGKALKKPAKAFGKAGDKWYAKTKQLQASPKKLDRIRGKSRIIVPMAGAAATGAVMGAKEAKKEIKQRTHAAGQIAPAASLTGTLKKGIEKVKKKFKKK